MPVNPTSNPNWVNLKAIKAPKSEAQPKRMLKPEDFKSTDAELLAERKRKDNQEYTDRLDRLATAKKAENKNIIGDKDWRQNLADKTGAIGDKLRVSNKPNFFDDNINPAAMVGNMASSIGKAPKEAKESNSIIPYVTSIGTPIATGALAGIGAKAGGSTLKGLARQSNELFNPLAGASNMISYKPKLKGNPVRFEPLPSIKNEQLFIGDGGRQARELKYKEYAATIDAKVKSKMTRDKEKIAADLLKDTKDKLWKRGDYAPKPYERVNPYPTNEMTSVKEELAKMKADPEYIPLSGMTVRKNIEPVTITKPQEVIKSEINVKNKDSISSIDWGKWNSEIPENKNLMGEYKNIEEASKKDGSWMKDKYGMPYKGTPEQFIQENSSNFKKAYPEGTSIKYRGIDRVQDGELNTSKKVGSAVFLADKKLAYDYAGTRYGNNRFFTAEEKLIKNKNQKTDGIHELVIPYTRDIISGNFNKESWRNLPLSKLNKNNEKSIKKGLSDVNREKAMTKEKHLKHEQHFFDKTTSTDDIAKYIEKNNIKGAALNNIYDSEVGNTYVHNNKSGSYAKSRYGNNGMFDLTNPNIYKAVVPAAVAGKLAKDKYDNKKPKQ